MNTLLDKILSRGYRRVIIRPARFVKQRVPDISALYPILQKTSVSLRGWNFPHLDRRNSPVIDVDWIGEEFDWEHHIHLWRLYQSGQFFHIANIPIDWRDQSSVWTADSNWKPGTLLGIGDTLFSFTEVFEFAARLALTDAGDDQMHIEITTGNLQERVLYGDSPNRWPLDYAYKASIEKFPYATDMSRSDLIARSRDLAREAAVELFKRFGWVTSSDLLKDWQEELRL